MKFFLVSLSILILSGFMVLSLGHFKKLCHGIFLVSLTAASSLVLISSFFALRTSFQGDFLLPWSVPLGQFRMGLDPLSAFFLITIACVVLAAGFYGCGYLRGHGEKKNIGVHYFFYLFLTLSLFLVVAARNAVLFLAAWELMTVFAYFLITYSDEKKSVRQAGYLYLTANHCGVFCLLAMFMMMGNFAGSMDFNQMAAAHYTPTFLAVFFILGLMGFGVKAGFFPIHIWLPHAHPAAPSHISAVLSGVVLKMGIYGILRMISMIDVPQWGGPLVLFIGAVSGVLGVLYALGQHEIKKLLAYHSIENIGIIALGIGMGLIGKAYHNNLISIIGYAGALLHVFNHAVFKGLLFLSAGSVIRSTGTGELDQMGGLLKSLPWTGHLFLVGSLSIAGFPLLNGFISEWMIYRSFLEGMIHFGKTGIILSVLSMISLTLIGGLAAVCFAKAFGVVFLGKARSHHEAPVKENSWVMRGPMVILAAICLWVGLSPKTLLLFSLKGVSVMTATDAGQMEMILQPILFVVKTLFLFLSILCLLALFKRLLFRCVPPRYQETWGCGYTLPSPRMQYTASSFADPVLRFFKSLVFFKEYGKSCTDYFPKEVSLLSKVVDGPEHFIFRPLLSILRKFSGKLLKLQSGYIPQYLLYILLAVVALLLWKFPWSS
ncbi:MAG: hydrogenase [Chlamydiae bacterium]|nr:hydrogenase [Chlamydiota bacterium]MBI3276317.1 hydrogenase [Chlamydiota bacterium]